MFKNHLIVIALVLIAAQVSQGGLVQGILDGFKGAPIDAPHVGSIQVIQSNGTWSHFCGGSIIARRTFLTAAHCINIFNITTISILVGTHDLSKFDEKYRYFIEKNITHPDYKEFVNDIGVLITKTPFEYNSIIKPIELCKDLIGGGVDAVMNGWGFENGLGPFGVGDPPSKLKEIKSKTLVNDKCNFLIIRPDKGEICTSPLLAGKILKSHCPGDSGSGLIRTDFKCLFAVVSSGFRVCGTGAFSDINTRVLVYIDFIKGHILN